MPTAKRFDASGVPQKGLKSNRVNPAPSMLRIPLTRRAVCCSDAFRSFMMIGYRVQQFTRQIAADRMCDITKAEHSDQPLLVVKDR